MRGRLALALWIAGLGGVLLALGAAGSGDLAAPPLDRPSEYGAWLDRRGPAVAAFALLRLVALLATGYLLLATLVGVAVRLAGAASAVSITDALTVPLVRRLLHTTLAAGLTFAAVAPPAGSVARVAPAAHLAPEPPPPVDDAAAGDAAATGTATMRLIEEPAAAPPPEPPAEAAARTHQVQPGDHLWSIAERALAAELEREPTEAEVVPYWRALIEQNRAVLADPDNPDLIFPGQVVTLPER